MIYLVYPEFYGIGGIARYIDSFLSNLPVGHPPITLVTGSQIRPGVAYSGVEIVHIPVERSRLGLFKWGWKVRRYLRDQNRKQRIELVNLHWPPLIPGLFLPPEIPLMLTAHTTYEGMSGKFYGQSYYPSEWTGLSLRIKQLMERWILRKTDAILTLTEQGRQEVLRYGFKGRIEVLPNGADAELFTPDPLCTKDIDVVFSGRIETRKGSRALGPVCRELVRLQPNIKIAIVGYGEDDVHVKEAIADLANNVVLTGKVPFSGMVGYLNRSKLYASTSYYEGLPGTCLEAMAMELPSVVWSFDFYKGLVEDGVTGYVVPPNQHQLMANKICELLGDEALRQSMGKASRKLLTSSYDWQYLAGKIVRSFNVISGSE